MAKIKIEDLKYKLLIEKSVLESTGKFNKKTNVYKRTERFIAFLKQQIKILEKREVKNG